MEVWIALALTRSKISDWTKELLSFDSSWRNPLTDLGVFAILSSKVIFA